MKNHGELSSALLPYPEPADPNWYAGCARRSEIPFETTTLWIGVLVSSISIDDVRSRATARTGAARARSLFEEARTMLATEREGEALSLLRQALLQDPENPEALSLYGVCLAKVIGDYEQGIRVCKLALHLSPGDVELRTNLGRVYRLRGDNSSAYRIFLDAWRRNRRHASPAAELASMGVRRKPVLRFLPRSHWCNRKLGVLRHRLRRLVRAPERH